MADRFAGCANVDRIKEIVTCRPEPLQITAPGDSLLFSEKILAAIKKYIFRINFLWIL